MNLGERLRPLRGFLDEEMRLMRIPARLKVRFVALCYLAGRFEPGARYTEKEVNALLNRWCAFRDPATLRRELYDFRFLNRERDGSFYWLEDPQPEWPE